MPGRREAKLSEIVFIALLPSLFFAIGQGAILPVIPTVAGSLGAGLEFAGFIAGAITIGQVLGDIPSGPIVARIGEKRAMLLGAGLVVAAVVLCLLASTPWLLLVGILLIGCAAAIFNLARHAFLTTWVPLRFRARALSTLGGVFRAGEFLGPFLAAGVIHLTGLAHYAFWIFLVCIALVVLVLLLAPDVERLAGAPRENVSAPADAGHSNVWSTIRAHRHVLSRLGAGAGLVMLLRSSRTVLLPLWALSIGLDAAQTALVMGIAGAVDFALFFTSGWIMDRFGRAWSAVPSMLGMGVGLVALAFTHDLPTATAWYVGLSIWTAIANGVGSGIVMTLGADLAPRERPAPFLGAWRLIIDLSGASVPFIVGGLTSLFALPVTAGALGILGLLGAGVMARYIPRFIPRPRA